MSRTVRDYLVGAAIVIAVLALSFALIRFTNGLVEPGVGEVGDAGAPREQAVEVAPAALAAGVRAAGPIPEAAALSDEVTAAELTGRFEPAGHPDFVRLDDRYTDGDGDYLLRREAAAALARMVDAARADGVELRVRSATRNHRRQSEIWGAKWRGERTLSNGVNLAEAGLSDSAAARMILLYSSMPGTSRHHWGTDVDFNAFENDYFAAGRGAAEYAWLRAHAADYGFGQPYTDKTGGRTGYEEERWHWSYAPLAVPYLRAYRERVGYGDIAGFAGAEVAPRVRAIEEYVLGVPAELQ